MSYNVIMFTTCKSLISKLDLLPSWQQLGSNVGIGLYVPEWPMKWFLQWAARSSFQRNEASLSVMQGSCWMTPPWGHISITWDWQIRKFVNVIREFRMRYHVSSWTVSSWTGLGIGSGSGSGLEWQSRNWRSRNCHVTQDAYHFFFQCTCYKDTRKQLLLCKNRGLMPHWSVTLLLVPSYLGVSSSEQSHDILFATFDYIRQTEHHL